MPGADEDRKQKQKEKRRLQEQLRRLTRNAEQQKNLTALLQLPKEEDSLSSSTSSLGPASGSTQLKCGACGLPGHMRTNRTCPFFQELLPTASSPSPLSPKIKDESPTQDSAPGMTETNSTTTAKMNLSI